MGLGRLLIRLAERQTASAKLEEPTVGLLITRIWGRFLQFFAMHPLMLPSFRVRLQRMRGVKIGKNVFIGAEVLIDPPYPDLVIIEDDVIISGHNIFIAHSSPTLPIREERLLKSKYVPTKVEQGVWMATGAMILPGVTVGRNSVVAAGAVVTKDVPPYTIVAGVPAKVIRKLETKQEDTN